jgi:hypothetical protein
MTNFLENKNFAHDTHKYLLDCDLVNKYSFENIHKKPKLSKVIVHFSLKNFSCANSTDDFNTQMRAILIFEIIFFLFPFISINNIRLSKGSAQKKTNFSLKIVLSNEEQINSFLNYLLIENFDRMEKQHLELLSKKVDFLEHKNLFSCYNLIFFGRLFSDCDEFLSSIFKDTKFKELEITSSILSNHFLASKNMLKNTSMFWKIN